VKTEIVIKGEKVFTKFKRMLRVAENKSEVLSAIGNHIKESTRLRFVDQRGPNGEVWAPVRRGGTPLRNTSTHLFNAINYKVSGDSVFVGVPHAWAVVHQLGATIKAKGKKLAFVVPGSKDKVFVNSVQIPARPFFGVNADDAREIRSIIRSKIVGSAA
jgi:phage virion morphogenesis protein